MLCEDMGDKPEQGGQLGMHSGKQDAHRGWDVGGFRGAVGGPQMARPDRVGGGLGKPGGRAGKNGTEGQRVKGKKERKNAVRGEGLFKTGVDSLGGKRT